MRDYSPDIEMAIPDNLRLGEHADAKLVNGLLARIIVCMEENDSVWRKNRMKCLHDTIARWNEEEFAPHIAKEEEDWNSLKSQIAANEAELASLRPVIRSDAELMLDRIAAANSTDELDPVGIQHHRASHQFSDTDNAAIYSAIKTRYATLNAIEDAAKQSAMETENKRLADNLAAKELAANGKRLELTEDEQKALGEIRERKLDYPTYVSADEAYNAGVENYRERINAQFARLRKISENENAFGKGLDGYRKRIAREKQIEAEISRLETEMQSFADNEATYKASHNQSIAEQEAARLGQ